MFIQTYTYIEVFVRPKSQIVYASKEKKIYDLEFEHNFPYKQNTNTRQYHNVILYKNTFRNFDNGTIF